MKKTITLYGLGNCDTVRKTRKWLDARDTPYDFHDYKKLGCPAQLAAKLLDQFEPKQLINTRGATWRKLPEKDKRLEPGPAALLMQKHPAVIKRPILDINGQWVVGFDAEKLGVLLK